MIWITKNLMAEIKDRAKYETKSTDKIRQKQYQIDLILTVQKIFL